MDYAKIACNVSNVNNLSKFIKNSKKNYKKVAKLITIPTTAGSGSEVTSGAVVYINKVKYSVEGKEIVPDDYFLIPGLVLNNSKALKEPRDLMLFHKVSSPLCQKIEFKSVKFATKSLKISFKKLHKSHL